LSECGGSSRARAPKHPFVTRRSTLPALGALALLAITTPGALGARNRQPAAPATGLRTVYYGKQPPDFSYAVATESSALSAHYGRPVVINFWATWCDPCRDELEAFVKLEQAYGDRVTLVTLSAEDAGVARSYLRNRGLDLPVAEDPGRAVFDAYSIGPIPVTIVLDPDGTVAHVAVGELDWNELRAAVDAALALEPAPASTGVRPLAGPSAESSPLVR